MGLVRTVEPDMEPLTLSEAKQHLNQQDIYEDDEQILAWIQEAREFAEDYTGRAFVTQTHRLTIDYEWPAVSERGRSIYRITLPKPPVVSVSSFECIGTNGDVQTLGSSDYVLYKRDTGEWAIEPAYGVVWPSVRCQPAAISVTFVSGQPQADVPESVRSAMKLLIGYRAVNREAVITGTITTEMPLGVRTILDRLRVHPYR